MKKADNLTAEGDGSDEFAAFMKDIVSNFKILPESTLLKYMSEAEVMKQKNAKLSKAAVIATLHVAAEFEAMLSDLMEDSNSARHSYALNVFQYASALTNSRESPVDMNYFAVQIWNTTITVRNQYKLKLMSQGSCDKNDENILTSDSIIKPDDFNSVNRMPKFLWKKATLLYKHVAMENLERVVKDWSDTFADNAAVSGENTVLRLQAIETALRQNMVRFPLFLRVMYNLILSITDKGR